MDVRTDIVQLSGREGNIISIRSDPAPELVLDVIYEIFRHLSVGDICHARMVCKAWSRVDWNEPRLLNVLKKLGMVFGKEEWNDHFGDVGEALRLPQDIGKILWAPSFGVEGYEGKRVWNSHLLTLIPTKVDGKPYCLNLLEDLIQSPRKGSKTKYDNYPDYVKNPYGSSCFSGSHWVLMMRNVLVGSRYKNYESQVELVEAYAKKTGIPFRVPNILAAATCILMHHVKSGERLYNNSPWTYTRCQEKSESGYQIDKSGYQISIGGFYPRGLDIDCFDYNFICYGVTAVREL